MESIQLRNYLILHNHDNRSIHKKNIKKLAKKQLLKRLEIKLVKTNDELSSLGEYLSNIKKKSPKEVGVLLNSNIILHDITCVPTPPVEYDILCLESEIKSYRKEGEDSVYWSRANIKSSGNFIINGGSIGTVIDIIEKSEDLTDFYNKLNNLRIYSITQTLFSQKVLIMSMIRMLLIIV